MAGFDYAIFIVIIIVIIILFINLLDLSPNMKATSVALIALLLVLAAAQRNYTKYTNLDNPNRFKQVVYLDTLSLVLVYGETNSTATAFRSYDWSPVTDSHYTNFSFAPTYVEAYKDDAHPLGNLIYGSASG